MIKVLFFGQLKAQLNTAELDVDASINTVSELRLSLQQRFPDWQDYLAPNQCLVAVNQSLCDDTMTLKDTDEVAFFPPVTGG